MSEHSSHYTSTTAGAHCGLCVWSFSALTPLQTHVVPDGCSDLIVDLSPSLPSRWFISALSDTTYVVPTQKHATMSGVRLRPGTQIDLPALQHYLRNRDPMELVSGDQLDEFCHLPSSLTTILELSGADSGQH